MIPVKWPPHFPGSLHLAHHLGQEFMRYVAVGAGGANAAGIRVVAGFFELRQRVFAHLVATGAERLGAGRMHGGVKSEQAANAQNNPYNYQG